MIFIMGFLALGFNAVALAGNVPPTLPPPGVDLGYEEVAGTPESVIDVIARHRKDTACRSQLTDAINVYEDAKKKLHDEVAHRASLNDQLNNGSSLDDNAKKKLRDEIAKSTTLIDSNEQDMRRAREPMLLKIEKCGPCVTHEPKQIRVGKQVWWTSDGSCQLEGSPAFMKAAYKKITESLLHLPEYSKHEMKPNEDDGGFYNVLQFVLVDPQTGALQIKKENLDSSPLYAYIAVRGIPVGNLRSFGYYFRNDYEILKEADGSKALYVTFNKKTADDEIKADGDAPQAPAGLAASLAKHPPFEFTASGNHGLPLKPNPLFRVMGAWYISSSGYLRYYTAADFGVFGMAPMVKNYARNILRDTIVQTLERAQDLK